MIWSAASALARVLPGEAAHRLAVKTLDYGIAPKGDNARHGDLLKRSVAGLEWVNPLGLAAGFDKNAEAIKGALGLGFGFTEVGTITPKPQPGNPKPRVFRLPQDGAVINRYGFNNDGMIAAGHRLSAYRQRYGESTDQGVIGVNIGANKDSADRVADYHLTAAHLARYADYMTVNVSSPNTPGLRGLQEPQFLKEVIRAAMAGMDDAQAKRPLMLKIAPDLDDTGLIAALDTAIQEGCSGIIIANTTISRPQGLSHPSQHEMGGLSGAPVFDLSNQMLHRAALYLNQEGLFERLPIIAVGGVSSAETAMVKLRLGASLVQLYTSLALKGPLLPQKIVDGLAARLKQDGLTRLDDITSPVATFQEAFRSYHDDRK